MHVIHRFTAIDEQPDNRPTHFYRKLPEAGEVVAVAVVMTLAVCGSSCGSGSAVVVAKVMVVVVAVEVAVEVAVVLAVCHTFLISLTYPVS